MEATVPSSSAWAAHEPTALSSKAFKDPRLHYSSREIQVRHLLSGVVADRCFRLSHYQTPAQPRLPNTRTSTDVPCPCGLINT